MIAGVFEQLSISFRGTQSKSKYCENVRAFQSSHFFIRSPEFRFNYVSLYVLLSHVYIDGNISLLHYVFAVERVVGEASALHGDCDGKSYHQTYPAFNFFMLENNRHAKNSCVIPQSVVSNFVHDVML